MIYFQLLSLVLSIFFIAAGLFFFFLPQPFENWFFTSVYPDRKKRRHDSILMATVVLTAVSWWFFLREMNVWTFLLCFFLTFVPAKLFLWIRYFDRFRPIALSLCVSEITARRILAGSSVAFGLGILMIGFNL